MGRHEGGRAGALVGRWLEGLSMCMLLNVGARSFLLVCGLGETP